MVRCQQIDDALIDIRHVKPSPGTRLHASASDDLSARRTGISFEAHGCRPVGAGLTGIEKALTGAPWAS
jgi:hypothetical protein